jgi:hypothetical protein
MEGVGELFGRSVDAVLRRPRTSFVPLAIDIVWLVLGTALFALVGFALQFPQGYRLPNFPVAVPHALPTVGDILGPSPDIHVLGTRAVLAACILVVLGIPLLAYAEAGFLGVLRKIYLTKHDTIAEGRHADAWSRIRESFLSSAHTHGPTFIALRGVQALLALVALGLPVLLPQFSSYGLGILAVDVLLLYAPYAAVETGRGAVAAIRESVQLVSDHLATTLVALLFGFLLTGGLGYLAVRVAPLLGAAAPFVLSAVYAPIGTLLALFLYRVYLGFYPEEAVPESTPSPNAAPG